MVKQALQISLILLVIFMLVFCAFSAKVYAPLRPFSCFRFTHNLFYVPAESMTDSVEKFLFLFCAFILFFSRLFHMLTSGLLNAVIIKKVMELRHIRMMMAARHTQKIPSIQTIRFIHKKDGAKGLAFA